MLAGMPETIASGEGRDATLRRRAEALGRDLQDALSALVGELGRRGMRDQRSIREVLQLSQPVVSRLLTSVRGGDPLTTLSCIPGQEALRQMLRGASASEVDADRVVKVATAVEEFGRFIDTDFGDRSAFDTVLSEWVVESRAAFEARHKAAAFKAMSALRGVQADVVLSAGIIFPTPGAENFSSIGIDALLGCRRTRPSGLLRNVGSWFVPPGAQHTVTSIEGGPIGKASDLLLTEFSTVTPDLVETVQHGDLLVETTIAGLPLGRSDDAPGVDYVCAQLLSNFNRRRRSKDSLTGGIGGHAEPPCEYFVVDVWLHDEVWPEARPEVHIFDTVVRGAGHPDDPARRNDRLDMVEAVQAVGVGPDAFRLPEYPRYGELLRHVCGVVGIDAAKLRGFRCKIRYPIYGSQIGIAFELPA